MITEVTRIEKTIYDYSKMVDGKPEQKDFTWTDVESFFLYRELSDELKEKARQEEIEREWSGQCGHYAAFLDDMWSELNELQKKLPLRFFSGRADDDVIGRWNGEFDFSFPAELEDNGECYSIDLCEIWNKHEAERQRIVLEHEDGKDDKAIDEWMKLMDSIADEMARCATEALNAERDWYTSHEFWDEWLYDSETMFNEKGERV